MKKVSLQSKSIVFLLIFIFSIQTTYAISTYNSTLNDYNIVSQQNGKNVHEVYYDYDSGYIFTTQAESTEYLKITIGAPMLIDEEASIQIFVAGLRSAKANYITPRSLKIELLSNDENFNTKYSQNPRFTCTGYQEENRFSGDEYLAIEDGEWIPDDLYPVTQMEENTPIYNCTFPAINMTANVKIRVTMEWRTPWYETLTQTAEKEIQVAPWEDFQKFLDTGSAEANAILSSRSMSSIKINEAVNEMRISTEVVEQVYSSFGDLEKFGSLDPATLHFYVLNLTMLTDDSNPDSFLSQLKISNITQYNAYKNILYEINQAYTETKTYLDQLGIEYLETIVNYTYTNGWDPNSFYYSSPISNASDCDYDEENMIDTSLEFLLEGVYWSTHPYLMHAPYNLSISGAGGNFPSTLDLTTGYTLINAPEMRNLNERTSQYTWIYDGYFNVSTINKATSEKIDITHLCTLANIVDTIYDKEHNITINAGNQITIPSDISSTTYNLSIEYRNPGEYFKPFKSIIVNLMYDLFPILNSYYSYPISIEEEGGFFDYENIAYAGITTLANFTSYNLNDNRVETLYFLNSATPFNELKPWNQTELTYVDPITSETKTLAYCPGQTGYDPNTPELSNSTFFEWILASGDYLIYYDTRDPMTRTNRYYISYTSNAWNQTSLPLNFEKLFLYNSNGLISESTIEGNIPNISITHEIGDSFYNISSYFNAFSQMGETLPFFINFVGKPFGRLIYDNDVTDGVGQYSSVYEDYMLASEFDAVFYNMYNQTTKQSFGYDFKFTFFLIANQYLQFSSFDTFTLANPKPITPDVSYPKSGEIADFCGSLFALKINNETSKTFNEYETTTPSRSYNWANYTYSPGIIPYTFNYLHDGITSEFQLYEDASVEINPSLLSTYSYAPYIDEGSTLVPIGYMYNGYSTLIQISSANLTSGLMYGYGMIFYTYKQAWLAATYLIDTMQQEYGIGNKFIKLQETQDKLDLGWSQGNFAQMNLTMLNDAILETVSFYTNPDSMFATTIAASKLASLSGNMTSYIIDETEPESSPSKSLSYNLLDIIIKEYSKDTFNTNSNYIKTPSSSQTVSDYINDDDFESDWQLQEDAFQLSFVNMINTIDTENEYINVSYMSGLIIDAWETSNEVCALTYEIKEETSGVEEDATFSFNQAAKTVFYSVVSRIRDMIISIIRPTIATIGDLFVQFIQDVTDPFIEYFDTTLPEKINASRDSLLTWVSSKLYKLSHAGDAYTDFGNYMVDTGQIVGAVGVMASIISGFNPIAVGVAVGGTISMGIGLISQKIGESLNKLKSVEESITYFITNTTDTLTFISSAIAQQFQNLQKFMLKIVVNMVQNAYIAIDNIISFIDQINNTITIVFAFFESFNDKVNTMIDNLDGYLEDIALVIVTSIGESVEIGIDYAQDLFPQLKELEAELKDSEQYLTIMDFFYPPFQQARLAAGYIDYAARWGEMNEATYYQWVDVYQPLSAISGADLGFQVYQIGDEFCDKLYFITYYNGSLIEPSTFDISVKKWTQFSDFGIRNQTDPNTPLINGSGIIEGIVTPQQVENVTGLYYIEFDTETAIDWQYEVVSEENDVPEATVAPLEGLYMTYVNATYPGKITVKEIVESIEIDPDTQQEIPIQTIVYTEMDAILNTTWAELSYLFNAQYIQDAFLQIDIEPDNDYLNSDGFMEINAGSDTAELKFHIINEMYSTPTIYVNIYISSTSGTPIWEGNYPSFVQMTPGEEDIRIFPLNVSSSTPGGQHVITYELTESNGDTYQLTSYIIIHQSNFLVNFAFALFDELWISIVLIGVSAILISAIIYARYKKTTSQTSDEFRFGKINNMRNIINECGYEKIYTGDCNHEYFNLKDWECKSKSDCKLRKNIFD